MLACEASVGKDKKPYYSQGHQKVMPALDVYGQMPMLGQCVVQLSTQKSIAVAKTRNRHKDMQFVTNVLLYMITTDQ